MKKVKIGVISDTHLYGFDPTFKRIVDRYFKEMDLIIHAGDLVDWKVTEIFRGKDLVVVCGNSDSSNVRVNAPKKRILEIEGYSIGVIHGKGPPFGILKRVRREFPELPHCIIFGHTHRALKKVVNGTLFFNPGAYKKGLMNLFKGSIGILEVERHRGIRAEIINYKLD